jgi:hypothetical protein
MTFTSSSARSAENSVAGLDAGTTDEGIREWRALTNRNRIKARVSKTSATETDRFVGIRILLAGRAQARADQLSHRADYRTILRTA